MTPSIEIIYTNPNTPDLKQGTDKSAGYDLCAMVSEAITINPGEKSILIPAGFKIHITDVNICAEILPRSGKGHKEGLVLGNGTGLIDAGYTGEIFISVCVRPGHDPVTITPQMRIAQLVFKPVIHPSLIMVNNFTEDSLRGEGGFGSTGA